MIGVDYLVGVCVEGDDGVVDWGFDVGLFLYGFIFMNGCFGLLDLGVGGVYVGSCCIYVYVVGFVGFFVGGVFGFELGLVLEL